MPVDADLGTENGKVRLNIGDVSEPYLVEDEIIDTFLSMYPSPEYTEEKRIYLASVDTLRFLKANYATQASARRREREGGVEVEVYENQTYEAICDLLDWFQKNPPSNSGTVAAGFIFGGVSKTKVKKLYADPDFRGSRAREGFTDDDNYSLIEGDGDPDYDPYSFYDRD